MPLPIAFAIMEIRSFSMPSGRMTAKVEAILHPDTPSMGIQDLQITQPTSLVLVISLTYVLSASIELFYKSINVSFIIFALLWTSFPERSCEPPNLNFSDSPRGRFLAYACSLRHVGVSPEKVSAPQSTSSSSPACLKGKGIQPSCSKRPKKSLLKNDPYLNSNRPTTSKFTSRQLGIKLQIESKFNLESADQMSITLQMARSVILWSRNRWFWGMKVLELSLRWAQRLPMSRWEIELLWNLKSPVDCILNSVVRDVDG